MEEKIINYHELIRQKNQLVVNKKKSLSSSND